MEASARLVRKAEAVAAHPVRKVEVVAEASAAAAVVIAAGTAAATGDNGFLDFSSLKRRPGGE